MRLAKFAGYLFALASCTRQPATAPELRSDAQAPVALGDDAAIDAGAPVATKGSERDASPPAQIDPDGDDDGIDTGSGHVPSDADMVKIGRAPLSLQRICDLTPHGNALYASHANQPLGTDGATVTRYSPSNAAKPFTVAFDWNRFGEPAKGGGAGQGFLRVHRIGQRLFVPDADPPYNGLGLVEQGTEGYVFVSDAEGKFAPPRAPHFRPPGPPDPLGRAGAAILPRAYHVIDAIRFRGRLYASTGSVPPTERAWRGASPGALHVANADWSRFTYEVDYPFPWKDGVWRLTFLVRFKDRLYAGVQDYDGRDPNDYVYFAPPKEQPSITRADAHPTRVTARGGSQTLRWYADSGKLYWIAWGKDGVLLRVTEDGDTWRTIALPDGAGSPTDITRFRDGLVVLTERRVLLLEGDAATEIARITDKKSPFELTDYFCAAPLGVLDGELYAGGQRDGSLYKLVPRARATAAEASGDQRSR